MLKIIQEGRFEKDIAHAIKRKKDMQKLWGIIELLIKNQTLSPKNRDHKLAGPFKDYRECHIEPDWLLIYKKTSSAIILARTGTHSDLF